jgi:hypothetical protein
MVIGGGNLLDEPSVLFSCLRFKCSAELQPACRQARHPWVSCNNLEALTPISVR